MRVPAYEDGAVCPETSAYKIQTPGNHPKAYNRLNSVLTSHTKPPPTLAEDCSRGTTLDRMFNTTVRRLHLKRDGTRAETRI